MRSGAWSSASTCAAERDLVWSAASCGAGPTPPASPGSTSPTTSYESPMTEKRGPYLECLACLTALAADTEHVRRRHLRAGDGLPPSAVLANALAAIDHLADGRLDAGLGAGWNVQEYSRLRHPVRPHRQAPGSSGRRHPGAARPLGAAQANFDGEHYQLTDALCEPKRGSSLVWPIWIGGVGEKRTTSNSSPATPTAGTRRTSMSTSGCGSPTVLDEWCERVRDATRHEIQRDVEPLLPHGRQCESDRARAEEPHFAEVFGPVSDAFRQRGAILGTPD